MNRNLPPGVTDADIPGNRPEDVAWDRLVDWLIDLNLSPEEIRERVSNPNREPDAMTYASIPRLHLDTPDGLVVRAYDPEKCPPAIPVWIGSNPKADR